MPAERIIRIVALLVLLTAIVITTFLLLSTEHGRLMLHDPHRLGEDVHRVVQQHSLLAPLLFVFVFIACTVLLLPVWWLQILAGYGFGLVAGIALSQVGATLGAMFAVIISRWIAADWFHQKVASRLKKLRDIDEKLGHNGLLVVMAIRLTHVLPFAASNYAIGLTRISVADVIVGNLLGGIPISTMYVTIGADPSLLKHWEFITIVAGINIVLLIPLALRYLKPQWFRKIGIE